MFGSDEKLKFPAPWSYRIVADADHEAVREMLQAVLDRHGIASPLKEGKLSSNGKYRSLHVEVTFESREMMEELSRDLQMVGGVKFLL